MKHRTIIAAAGVFMAVAPVNIAFGFGNCGWCGSDAQALGRALNMGAGVPCYCPPPPQPRAAAKPSKVTVSKEQAPADKSVEPK